MTEVVLHQTTELSIVPEQQTFTPAQRTALSHIGVEEATEADIEVFFHVVKRTGLDPFARQIYMIGRKSQGKVKQTIQTGIDGYRLIGRRAANAAGATLSLKPVQWAHRDGGWRDVWMAAWGVPVAARVTIVRSGEEFTATALFDEYKQTKFDGGLTQMWNQRPAGQIAKCAEALAWRMAFPQDLSGIYVDEEMQQADAPRVVQGQVNGSAKDAVRAAIAGPTPPADEAPAAERTSIPETGEAITQPQMKKLHASFNEFGISDRDERLAYSSKVLDRELESSTDLTKSEAHDIIEALVAGLADAPAKGKPDLDPPDVLWQRCVTVAKGLGWDTKRVETALLSDYDVAPFDATAEQLDAFLTSLEAEAA